MTVPQPASTPYEEGDEVKIYLSKSDPDAAFNDTRCTVVRRLQDDLHSETGRDLDQ